MNDKQKNDFNIAHCQHGFNIITNKMNKANTIYAVIMYSYIYLPIDDVYLTAKILYFNVKTRKIYLLLIFHASQIGAKLVFLILHSQIITMKERKKNGNKEI